MLQTKPKQKKEKPSLSEREAKELIKGMGREATIIVHPNGHATATAISAKSGDPRIQNEVDELLRQIQKKYRIVKKRY